MTRAVKSKQSDVGVSTSEHVGSRLDLLRVWHVFRELLEAAAVFIVVFFALHLSIQNFRIEGTSMSPTLVNEQHILVSKLPYVQVNPGALKHLIPFVEKPGNGPALFASGPPGYGDVIAFTDPLNPSRELLKRVIGMPGDTIELDRGRVIRNGEPLDESYVVNRGRRSIKPVKVPEGSYYMLGDNRPASSDSRNWGFVPGDHIIGRAWFSYWPSDRFEFLHALR